MKRDEWITGPKSKKSDSFPGWRQTEALMQKQKLIKDNSSGRGNNYIEEMPLNNPEFQSPVVMGKRIAPGEKLILPEIPRDVLPRKTSEIKRSGEPTHSIDDLSENYSEETMMDKIKSNIPEKTLFPGYDYYESDIFEDEENNLPVLRETVPPKSTTRTYLEKMISYSPSESLTENIIRELELLGDILVGECQQFGIGIIIFEYYRNLTEIKIDNQYPFPPGTKVRDGRGWEVVRGAYNSQHRMMFIAEELATGEPGGVATHEFAHAYDHAWMINNQMQFGFSLFLWNKFYNERVFITEYAATQPKEYFAVSLESYFNPNRKELLKKCDPKMYGFIKNLIAGVHKKPKVQLSD